ncbi:hypothetical protein LY76DRAFT_680915 [Colletotrichum caudatum]|nr:hypothetical protein LY76DRAFT_680915 [Colletotrichum caudatum]
MKSTIYILALFLSLAIAAPAGVKRVTDELDKDICEVPTDGSSDVADDEKLKDLSAVSILCELGKPFCCSSKDATVKSVDCMAPSTEPVTLAGFEATCAATGKKHSRCCLVEVDGHSLVCD